MLQFSLPCTFDSLCCLAQMNENMRVQNEHYNLKMKNQQSAENTFYFYPFLINVNVKSTFWHKTSGYGHVNKLQILLAVGATLSFVTKVCLKLIRGENLFTFHEYIHDHHDVKNRSIL